MILVDTSVWIDFFNGTGIPWTAHLKNAITDSEDLCVCGTVYTEVLQGIRSNREFSTVQHILDDLIYLPQEKSTHLLAAAIYRALRSKGKTIRNPVDCIIAAVCIENSAFLLHNDRDFDFIAGEFPLQRYGKR